MGPINLDNSIYMMIGVQIIGLVYVFSDCLGLLGLMVIVCCFVPTGFVGVMSDY